MVLMIKRKGIQPTINIKQFGVCHEKKNIFTLKEQLGVISSNPQCKDDNARFTTVPFIPISKRFN